MKKLLIVLIVLVSVGLFATTQVELNPWVEGTVKGSVLFDKDGKHTALQTFDLDLGWGFSVPHDNLSISVSLDEPSHGLSVGKLTIENDNLGLTWFSSMALSGDDSLKWFNYLDDGLWNHLMVMNFKQLNFHLATQDGTDDKIAVKANILDMVDIRAQAKFNVYTFVSAAGEVYVTPIENLSLKAGYEYDSNRYFAGANYSMTVADLVTLSPYAFYSTDWGQYAGLRASMTQGIFSINAGYEYDIAANSHFVDGKLSVTHDIASAWVYGDATFPTNDYTAQVHASTSQTFGPLTVSADVGSGDYNNWFIDSPTYGNLVDDIKDLSAYAKLSVTPELGLGVISDPTLTLDGGYYLLDNSYSASINLATKLYDLLNISAGISDLFDLSTWYVEFYYAITF
ncbi:MAG: hypothetical protein FXF54_04110 [Kosmotoga sp.]|nr:MAG: hypothetical protein FXF54_04110 [Kosmotoga sp.]